MTTKMKERVTLKKQSIHKISVHNKQTFMEGTQNSVICIIGMHRSGTSMVARLLNLCGLALGPSEQLLEPNEYNPKGYFENNSFFKINESLLTQCGGSWDNPPHFKEDWEYDPSLKEIVNDAKLTIDTFSKHSHWGWKDPRATILLPFWKSLIPNLRFVICVRSPLEIAKSLASRDRFSIRKGVYLWNQYMQAAVRDTEGYPRIYAFYEDFFKDASGEIDRLIKFCGLQKLDDMSILHKTISCELKHHTSETLDLLNESKIISEYKLFYIGLRALTNDKFLHPTLNSKREELISKNISKFFKMLEEFHDEQKVAQLQSELADLKEERDTWRVKAENLEKIIIDKEEHINHLIEKVGHGEGIIAEKERNIRDLIEFRENLEKILVDKEGHINSLTEHTGNLEKVVADKECHINNLTEHTRDLEEILADKEGHINNLTEHGGTLEEMIKAKEDKITKLAGHGEYLEGQLVNKETHINGLKKRTKGLKVGIKNKEEQICLLVDHSDNLEMIIADKETNINKFVEHTENLEKIQAEKEEHIGNLLKHAENLEEITAGNQVVIDRLQTTVQSQGQMLNTIYASLGWKIVRRIWKLTDVFLPIGSNRRQITRLVFNSPALLIPKNLKRVVKYLRLFGLRETFKEVSKNLRNYRYIINEVTNTTPIMNNINVLGEETLSNEDVTISVVIPVKNAGDHFRRLLSMVTNQKGFRNIEIIVVDSGSTDRSLDIAKEFGAKIIEIPPEEFSHSGTRTLGAENASGDFLLITVQDALPPSEFWLHELYRALYANDVIAVSCAEFPMEDADLFYRVISWNHYSNFLEIGDQDRIMSKPVYENHLTLRKNGQLSDIACLIYRDVFMKYKYRGDYAEDLDLGIRLIRDGHKLALLSSTRIIHSHNRPAYHFLKRGYVDELVLSQILQDRSMLQIQPEQLLRDIIFTFDVVNSIVHDELRQITLPCTTEELSTFVMDKLNTVAKYGNHAKFSAENNGYVDSKFRSFMENVHNNHFNVKDCAHYDGILLGAMQSFTKMIFEYIDYNYEFIDEHVLEEFMPCFYKAYAFQCGTYLASCFVQGSESTKEKFHEINKELTKEI